MINLSRTGTGTLRLRQVLIIGAVLLCSIAASVSILQAGDITTTFGRLYSLGVLLCLLTMAILILRLTQVARVLRACRWWHLLWILAFASALVFRKRHASDLVSSPVDAWALYRIVLVAFIGGVLALAFLKARAVDVKALSSGPAGFLSAYSIVCIASSMWSVYPAWTLYKSSEIMIDILLLGACLSAIQTPLGWKSLFTLTWSLFGLLLISCWLSAFVWPNEGLWQGVGTLGIQLNGVLPYVAANDVGEMSALLSAVILVRYLSRATRSWQPLALLALTLATLIFSQTRAAILGFLLALPVVLYLTRRRGLFLAAIAMGLMVIASTSATELFVDYMQRGQTPGTISTLTGRLDWWRFGWETYLDQPLIGYGAFAASRFHILARYGESLSSHIHNAWLEVLFGVGLIGITPLAVAVVWTSRILTRGFMSIGHKVFDAGLKVEAIAVLIIILVRSGFGSGMVWHPPLLLMLLIGYASSLRNDTSSNPAGSLNTGYRSRHPI